MRVEFKKFWLELSTFRTSIIKNFEFGPDTSGWNLNFPLFILHSPLFLFVYQNF